MSALRRLTELFRTALSSHDHDFTSGSIGRAVALLAVPMVLEPLMESLFAVVDVLFIGRLGAGAVASVGLTEGLIVLIYTIGFGLGIPTTALVARAIGEGRPERSAVFVVQALLASLAVALPVAVAGWVFAEPLLALMGAEPAVQATGAGYARIMLASSPLITVLFVLAAAFRGSGDAVVSLRALWLANGLNIVLDPCLIFGLGPFPELGLEGAALATVFGRGLGVVYLLWRLLGGTARLRLLASDLRVDGKALGELLRLSVGGIGQLLVETTSWVFLVRVVSLSGSVAVAGYTIAIRLFLFCLMPAWGLSGAAATLVGQNLGAQKPERAERALWITGWTNMAYLAVITVLYMVAGSLLARAFTDDLAVRPVAAEGLRIIAYGCVFYGWGMVLVQAFNGAGDTRTPFVLNLVCFWAVKLPLAYVLSTRVPAFGGASGVYVAVALAYSLNAVLAFVWFRTGRWKRLAPEAVG